MLQPVDYPAPLRLLYDWQTLAAAVLAIIAALIAAWPVWKQIKLSKVQSAVMSRDALVTRLAIMESRRNSAREKIGSATAVVVGLREPNEDEDKPLI